jgi:hypothetical protein
MNVASSREELAFPMGGIHNIMWRIGDFWNVVQGQCVGFHVH